MDTKIQSDIEAGETPVLLTRLTREAYVPKNRNGKSLHLAAPFRWASVGCNGHKLETLKTPTGLVTTRSAVLRFFAALSGAPAPSIASTPRQRQNSLNRAEKECAAAGI